MLFNSYIFILIFLPLSVLGYFLLNKISHLIAQVYLVGMSLWFYGYANSSYIIIIIFSILFNYCISRALQKINRYRKVVLLLSIAINIGLIFYFKYFMFSISILNSLFKVGFPTWFIEMPLGISFFTIQQISFLVDSYRKETSDYGIVEYALFVSFFPQLVAGPIVLHDEMIPQFRNRKLCKVNYENIISGTILFTSGLFKKIMVADIFLIAVDWGYDNYNQLTAIETILVFLAFTLQLYFDFSAYSDMATGIARMFNWNIAINFDSPLKSLSINEFWTRWHMTLNRFLTKYVYIPLGGSRRGIAKTYRNLLIVFAISGLWHGANYTYILWGLLNGVACILYRVSAKIYDRLWKILRWGLNFTFVVFSFGLFRSNSVSKWIYMIKNACLGRWGISAEFMQQFKIKELVGVTRILDHRYPYIEMIVLFVLSLMVVLFFENNYRRKIRINAVTCVVTSAILVWCIFTLSSVTRFLYFNF